MKVTKIQEPKMIFASIQEVMSELKLLGMRIPSAANEIVLECHTKLDYAYLYFYCKKENVKKMIGGHRLDSVDREHFFKYLQE